MNHDLELQNQINKIIKPTFVEDIKKSLSGRKHCKTSGDVFIVFSKILVIVAAIIAFIESYFKTGYLNIVSGTVSLVGVSCSQFSEFSYKQSSKHTMNTNEVLAAVELQPIPDIADDNFGYKK